MSGAPLREAGRTFGLWSPAFRVADRVQVAEAAAELEQLGWSALWYPGGFNNTFDPAPVMLEATTEMVVATGIANIWVNSPEEATAAFARIDSAHPGRFLLGLGVSHSPFVERLGVRYEKPLARLAHYLDALDAAPAPVPIANRIIGALGPRMLALAAARSLGTHPYLVTPEHTARMRSAVGSDARVMPEQGVVLETDPVRARTVSREALAPYLALPNYVNNWLRLGFTLDDVTAGGSDRLVDALVAWGTPEQVCARLRAHADAGADHVCAQVLGAATGELPMGPWRELAGALDLFRG